VPPESPTPGFTHLQFEVLLTAARESPNVCDFALVPMLGRLGLRIFEATGTDIADLGEEHGHRVLRVCGKGSKVVLIPPPPAVGRAIDQAIGTRARGPILLNSHGTRMDQHAATRRLRRLARNCRDQDCQAAPSYAQARRVPWPATSLPRRARRRPGRRARSAYQACAALKSLTATPAKRRSASIGSRFPYSAQSAAVMPSA
jgi:hypothetical protein